MNYVLFDKLQIKEERCPVRLLKYCFPKSACTFKSFSITLHEPLAEQKVCLQHKNANGDLNIAKTKCINPYRHLTSLS